MAGSRSSDYVFGKLFLCIFSLCFSHYCSILRQDPTLWPPRVLCIYSILSVKPVERASVPHNPPNGSPESDSYSSETSPVPIPAPITEVRIRSWQEQHPPAPRQKGILIPPADLRSPNGTNVISHFLSSAHISLLTGDSAHPFWGLLPLGCLLLFKEMVTVITKTSLSSPGPSSATTESEPLEASQLLALAVGQRIVIAPIY